MLDTIKSNFSLMSLLCLDRLLENIAKNEEFLF